MKESSPLYLSAFCNELALLARAGIPLGDGLALMRDDDGDRESAQLLSVLCKSLEHGLRFSAALAETGHFPDYLVSLIRLGETSGRMEESLAALAKYYENKNILTENLRRAVVYPLLLLGLLSAVAVVIITQVLPIFNQIFNQAGVEMSGLAISLMGLGRAFTSASTAILSGLVLLVGLGLLASKSPPVKRSLFTGLERRWGGRGIWGRIARSRFAMAMSMAISSGLYPEEAVSLAGDVCGAESTMAGRVAACKTLLEQGETFEKSLLQAEILSAQDCRLLALGMKAGEIDTVMSEIARRGEEHVLDELDRTLGMVEPALVITMSLIVGLMLFSVMLPLMGIMSSLG